MTVGAGPDPEALAGGAGPLLARLRLLVDDPVTARVIAFRTTKLAWLLDRIAQLEQALVAAHESNQDDADEIVAAHAARDVAVEALAEVTAQANSWQRHAQDADTALTAALAENERLRAAVGQVIRCDAEQAVERVRALCDKTNGRLRDGCNYHLHVDEIRAALAPVASLPPEEDR